MSGLVALFERDGRLASERRIAAMLRALRHRGPDRSAHIATGPVGLGHAMLETTPEDALDRQPLRDAAADRILVADARLDNRDALLRQRGLGASPARETTDSELILWAYERWGRGCVSHLVGDFAFVIWDAKAQSLFCARDPFGARPLYYANDEKAFRCASEMSALFVDPRVRAAPHRTSMVLTLVSEYLEREETLWDGVLALPAGHALVVTREGLQKQAFWRPDPWKRVRHASDDAYAEHFASVFGEAVRCRMRACGPVAAQVSGGLDSSSVACVAAQLTASGEVSNDLSFARFVFPGTPADESAYSDAVAARYPHPMLSIDATDPALVALRPTTGDRYFHPMIAMLDPMLSALAEGGTRTLLTGIAGDQLMRATGEECASDLRAGRAIAALEGAGVDAARPSAASLRKLASQAASAFAPRRPLAWLRRIRRPAPQRWPLLDPKVADEALALIEAREAEAASIHPDRVTRDLASRLTHSTDIPFVLALQDRAAAAFGVELRHPFLDVRVIELLLAMPHAQRFSGGVAKPVLRRAMRSVLPSAVAERQDKADFQCYLRRFFFSPQRKALLQLFSESRLADRGMLNPTRLRRGIESDDLGSLTDFISMVSLELWLHQAVIEPECLSGIGEVGCGLTERAESDRAPRSLSL